MGWFFNELLDRPAPVGHPPLKAAHSPSTRALAGIPQLTVQRAIAYRDSSKVRAAAAELEEALAGRGRIVLLQGEPGIGKTRIAEELAESARREGAEVLWGSCHEGSGAPPF